MLTRLSLLLSLLGMILSLHLWIQKERNFDQGCWGVGQTAAGSAAAGCKSDEFKKYSAFLGVSVAAWGYAFYLSIGALALGKVLLAGKGVRICHLISEIAVLLAFPFSLYLVFVQVFLIKALCPLCLLSSGLVVALFVLHVIQYRRGEAEPLSESERVKEIGYASGLGFLAMGVLAALMIMVNQIGTRRLDQGETAQQFETMLGKTLPKQIDPARLMEMKPALYDSSLPPLEMSAWLTGELPPLGRNSAISLVAFLDPNCPSCKGTYASVRLLGERLGDRMQVHVISRTLWSYSELQSQALELAAQAGKYHEMWQLQFDHAKQGGLKLGDLEKLFAELGLEVGQLQERLAAVRPVVLARRERAIAAGVRGTPSIYLNGRAVAYSSTDLPSLMKLIDRAEVSGSPKK